jgi:Mg-chelatase subunit ChlD
MINVNYTAGSEVVDLRNTDARSLARTYVGIVTYEDMAKCLGWPDNPIGYADLLALRNNPDGWSAYSCANPDWGKRPLVAFTDPSISDTGRSVIMSLYVLGSGKAPEGLTEADLQDPAVIEYVRNFQSLVDHYMPTTLALNTRVCEGPRYGHFFIMPEDNLTHLLDGTEKCLINGVEQDAPPLNHKLVFIYPEEGTLLRENCACAVKASWVDAEEAAATELWVRFLQKERQQVSFQAAGFHSGNPSSSTGRAGTIEAASPPTSILHPERIAPNVARAIDDSWHVVKRPAIVTFVADTSGSMLGDKLRSEQAGLIEAFNQMATNNQVGLVTFGDSAKRVVEVAPVTSNKAELVRAVGRLRAEGETALYDAIREGIAMTDAAAGAPDAIRAVVVITDGRANRGSTCLHDIVAMTSLSERPVEEFCGMEHDRAREQGGRAIARSEVAGTSLSLLTQHDIQVFYVAIGKDADLDIGRVLSGATGAEFRGVTQADLSELILEFSHYF